MHTQLERVAFCVSSFDNTLKKKINKTKKKVDTAQDQTDAVTCNKSEKKFGGLGLSELGQTEDSRGLLSGMIECRVAYLVAVHPQIV